MRAEKLAWIQAEHDLKNSKAWEAFQSGKITEDRALERVGKAFEWMDAELLKIGLIHGNSPRVPEPEQASIGSRETPR